MIWSGSETQDIDRLSSQIYGIPSRTLMEEAGKAIFRLALRLWKPYSHFILLAGSGNNGGDALVAARLLFEADFSLTCFDVSDGKESNERHYQRLELEKKGFALKPFRDAADFDPFRDRSLIIIDGLLGLGLKGSLRDGLTRNCLEAASHLHSRVVLAIDLPSGLEADTWDTEPARLPATHTITFGALKPVHVGEPSRRWCGDVNLATLGFAPEAIQDVLSKRTISLIHDTYTPALATLWRHLPPDAHKYDRGHVLAIGGSPGKVGAIMMAAAAALKGGAGWVTVAPLSEIMAPAWSREFTYETFGLEGEIDLSAMKRFIETRKVKAVLIGPGTMETPLTRKFMECFAELQKKQQLRLVFDAGALSDILKLSEGLAFDPDHTLLTPHPGEWKRLQKEMPTPQHVGDIWDLCELTQKQGMSMIYKSASPMIFAPESVRFLTQGDNRLGRAGSGDLLAGLILGLSSGPYSLHELAGHAQNMLALSASRLAASQAPLELLNGIV
ncbi:MAG: NAD(P)H-hydrate epimerase [Chitinophagaceae bacterium]|nr:NAD(P)H-hydrate epimerase [Oligoflexus sp.]